jgi:hypothetical protein
VVDRADPRSGHDLERVLADAFDLAGWKVEREPEPLNARYRPDLIVSKDTSLFVVELKVVSDARRDRLISLFSQAVLQVGAAARHHPPARPLAVVAASHMPESIAEHLRRFAADFAPDVAFGIIDADGFRYFSDPALNELNARPAPRRGPAPVAHRSPNWFSDLNQWMLKVLLAPRLPDKFLSAPRAEYRNASELANAAGVSVMTAFRFVSLLQDADFLDIAGGRLRLVRIEELMLRWQAASLREGRDIPARWILGGDGDRLGDAVRAYVQAGAEQPLTPPAGSPVRVCLGLFAAADRLGLGFVHGPISHVYIERPDVPALRKLGLSLSEPGEAVDVFLRVPAKRESLFRAAVRIDDVPVSDVLQIWLDVQGHPARGRQQAEELRRRVLEPLFSEAQT